MICVNALAGDVAEMLVDTTAMIGVETGAREGVETSTGEGRDAEMGFGTEPQGPETWAKAGTGGLMCIWTGAEVEAEAGLKACD